MSRPIYTYSFISKMGHFNCRCIRYFGSNFQYNGCNSARVRMRVRFVNEKRSIFY